METSKKVVPGPDSASDVIGAKDSSAEDEALAFGRRDLDAISKKNEHGRRERFRNHIAKGAVVILWTLMSATVFAIFTVAWHYLMPWPWLEEEQLVGVRAYVFSGAVVAALGGYFRRYAE